MKNPYISIYLGTGEQALRRKTALEQLAAEEEFEWDGEPSIGRLITAIADGDVRIESIRKETKMSTTAVFARGAQWSAASLYDGWGDNVTDEQAEALSDLVVEHFERWCRIAGDPSIAWFPTLSEVHGEVYGEDTDNHGQWDPVHPMGGLIDMEHARKTAIRAVWDAVIGESTGNPVADRVAEILGDGD